MTLKNIGRPTLSTTVQTAIKDYIIERGLVVGDPIPTEKQLEDELGISRAAIRESLKSLEALGIIGVKPGVGRFLKQFDFETILNHLSFNIELNPRNFSNVLELRQVLECTFLKSSLDLYTDEDISDFHELLNELSRKVESGEPELELIRLHTQFHLELYRHVDNQLLKDLIKIFATIQRTVWVTYNHVTQDREAFIEFHRNIVDAIEQRDPVLAEKRIREHFGEVSSWSRELAKTPTVRDDASGISASR